MKSDRGVLYIVWGDGAEGALARSRDSLKTHHPELPVHVERLGDGATLLDKARMGELTPYQETLYLDADTVVLGRLDFAFDKAAGAGLACAICECPWARRYGGLAGEMVEYNTGVMFFNAKAKGLFEAWKKAAHEVDSSIVFASGEGEYARMPLNDQAGFAQAVDETDFRPFVLPLNWNFRPRWHKSWFGPIKVWHDYQDVPAALVEQNARQADEDAAVAFSVLTS